MNILVNINQVFAFIRTLKVFLCNKTSSNISIDCKVLQLTSSVE